MSVKNSFSTLVERIQPSEAEIKSAKQHIGSIQARLNTVFEISSVRVTGSFARSTSISGFSDIDLFAVFRKDQFTRAGSVISSARVLEHIRQDLMDRYPNTPLGKDGMAITISYSDGQIVDVVPALFDSMFKNKYPVYLIPDGAGGWMKTSPSLYDAYIKQADAQSGSKLTYVAQLIKYWRNRRPHTAPISSFHIEMVLASEDICKGVKSYGACLRDLFRSLASRDCRAIRDPYGISGYIAAVKTESQIEFANNAVRYSRDHSNLSRIL